MKQHPNLQLGKRVWAQVLELNNTYFKFALVMKVYKVF